MFKSSEEGSPFHLEMFITLTLSSSSIGLPGILNKPESVAAYAEIGPLTSGLIIYASQPELKGFPAMAFVISNLGSPLIP